MRNAAPDPKACEPRAPWRRARRRCVCKRWLAAGRGIEIAYARHYTKNDAIQARVATHERLDCRSTALDWHAGRRPMTARSLADGVGLRLGWKADLAPTEHEGLIDDESDSRYEHQ